LHHPASPTTAAIRTTTRTAAYRTRDLRRAADAAAVGWLSREIEAANHGSAGLSKTLAAVHNSKTALRSLHDAATQLSVRVGTSRGVALGLVAPRKDDEPY
jgi:hypothetical protein